MPGLTRQFSSVYTLSALHDAVKCRSSPSSHRRARWSTKGVGSHSIPSTYLGGSVSIRLRWDQKRRISLKMNYLIPT